MQDRKSRHIALIYLGRRGGGAQLTRLLSELYTEEGFDVQILASSNRDLSTQFRGSVYHAGPFNPKAGVRTLGLSNLIALVKAMNWIVKNGDAPKIWIMSHPFDLPLRYIARTLHGSNISIIHEYASHSGEWWPPKIVSWLNVKSADVVIALSRFVANEIRSYHMTIDVRLLPLPNFRLAEEQKVPLLGFKKYFLVIGRIRSYKGLSILLQAWEKVSNEPSFSEWTLVIAGQGKVPRGFDQLKNTFIINRWLTDIEMSNYIQFTSCIVLPYRDASQSGILSLAETAGISKIVFDSGGLTEQIDQNTILIHNKTETALSQALREVSSGRTNQKKDTGRLSNFERWESKWISLLED